MIQVYTGEGKGKTTAAIGLAVRASCEFKVLFLQVLKDGTSSEMQGLAKIKKIKTKSFGLGKRIYPDKKNKKEKENTEKAIGYIKKNHEKYDVIILDEGITAVNLKIITEEKVLDFMRNFPKEKELILTGRGATKKIIDASDLVTEMKPLKHYYDVGQKARKGIEL